MDKCLSISELNQLIKTVLDHDPFLGDIYCIGEISSLRVYEKKRISYLTLSDTTAQISAICFQNLNQHNWIKEGAKVKCYGKIQFFNRKGQLNLQIQSIQAMGDGDLSKSFLELKTKLDKEGLFNQSRKIQIPSFPKSMAIITATPSAALADFMLIRKQYFSHIKTYVIQSTVQGLDCPQSVIDSLNTAQLKLIDLVVIMRGGGATEELAGFNSEALVRTLSNYNIPVLTAIGHQSDITLADLVADQSVSTPTAAAQFIAKPYLEIRQQLKICIDHLSKQASECLNDTKSHIFELLNSAQMHCDSHLQNKKQQIQNIFDRLSWNNPLQLFQQGHSRTLTQDGKVLKSIASLQLGSQIVTQTSDGEIYSCIESVKPLKWRIERWKNKLKN